MRRFEIAGRILSEDDPTLPATIAAAYRDRIRPLCLCRQPGIPMYVAAVGEQFVVKRMPLSGGQHDPACDSYEPPVDLSGLGPLMGSAIRLDPASGMAALRLEFSLTRTGSRAAPTPGASESTSVKSEARRLSLRGLLHALERGRPDQMDLGLGRQAPLVEHPLAPARSGKDDAGEGRTAERSSVGP